MSSIWSSWIKAVADLNVASLSILSKSDSDNTRRKRENSLSLYTGCNSIEFQSQAGTLLHFINGAEQQMS
jgi:hypothetical protein